MARGSLAVERCGTGPPLVLVHGFTQTGRCWGSLPARLASDTEVVAVDAPGHGGSSAIAADLWATADLLADAIAGEGPATVVGYSMGARMALHAALAHPRAIERLVLISGTAGIDDDTERAARRAADEALAAHLESVGVDAFLDERLSAPLFAGLAPESQDRAERATNTAAGLASSLRLAGTGTQDPLWARLGDLAMPVLVVAGGDDAKFADLARRIAEGIGPAATLAIVDGAGHTVHRERPDEFADLLVRWRR